MIAACLIGLATVVFYARFIDWCEYRPQLVEIPDPFFQYLPLRDTSWPIGATLWGSALWFFTHWREWDHENAIWCFVALMISRSFVLYTHPFRGHHTMIPLRDPILEFFTRTARQPYLNDCSFGGHCSTLFALGLLHESQRALYFTAALVTSILIVISRAHYTADNLIAPMFSYWCFKMAPSLREFWSHWVSLPLSLALALVMVVCSLRLLRRQPVKHPNCTGSDCKDSPSAILPSPTGPSPTPPASQPRP